MTQMTEEPKKKLSQAQLDTIAKIKELDRLCQNL